MNPPSNTPPNIPGQSNLPPAPPPYGGSGGASGGAQGIPPRMTPPATSGGGGLFSARNIIIGLVALVFLCCVCGGLLVFVVLPILGNAAGTTISNQLETTVPGGVDQIKIAATGQAFMQQLKDGKWPEAYALCTPALQKDLGSAAELGKKITDGKAQPISWNFTVISDVTPASKDAQIDGTAVLTGNVNGTMRLVLDRVASDWKISGFNLKPK